MIETVIDSDIGEIQELIAKAVRISVASSEEDAEFLIDDIGKALDWWLLNKDKSCHLKYVSDREIIGVILIINFWNLSLLFVDPSHYKQGIGRALFEAAVTICKEKPDVQKIKLNSSTYAADFYKAIGFVQTGSGKDLPGGCIPYEYVLLEK